MMLEWLQRICQRPVHRFTNPLQQSIKAFEHVQVTRLKNAQHETLTLSAEACVCCFRHGIGQAQDMSVVMLAPAFTIARLQLKAMVACAVISDHQAHIAQLLSFP
jgi:hypothetical protein